MPKGKPTDIETKRRALKAVEAGRAVADVARELHIHKNELYRWRRKYRSSALVVAARPPTPRDVETRRRALQALEAGRTVSDVANELGVAEERLGKWRRVFNYAFEKICSLSEWSWELRILEEGLEDNKHFDKDRLNFDLGVLVHKIHAGSHWDSISPFLISVLNAS